MIYLDQYLSTVIIAIITGVFSVITLILQNRQDSVINKIDAQTEFIDREKRLRGEINKKESERQQVINRIMIIIFDTNTAMFNEAMKSSDTNAKRNADEYHRLKEEYIELSNEINDLNRKYELIMEINQEQSISE